MTATKPHNRWAVPAAAVARILQVARQRAALEAQLRELPSARQLAKELQVNPSTIFRIRRNGNKTPPPGSIGEAIAKNLLDRMGQVE